MSSTPAFHTPEEPLSPASSNDGEDLGPPQTSTFLRHVSETVSTYMLISMSINCTSGNPGQVESVSAALLYNTQLIRAEGVSFEWRHQHLSWRQFVIHFQQMVANWDDTLCTFCPVLMLFTVVLQTQSKKKLSICPFSKLRNLFSSRKKNSVS